MARYYAYVLVPGDAKDVEGKVSELMELYNENLAGVPYQRECECVYDSVMEKLNKGQYFLSGTVNASWIEFKKDVFEKAGPELILKLEFLRLGTPDPQCENCRGSGISTTTCNCIGEWDFWEIVPILTEEGFKDCLTSGANISPDQQIVPVSALDFGKVPAPEAVVTPDGSWHTYRKLIWFSNAMIVDENWEHTFKNLLAAYPDAALVVVDYHS